MNSKTLTEGMYDIPKNCRAIIRAGQVVITRRSIKLDLPLCVTCIHCVPGYTSYTQVYEHKVCELKPKPIKGQAALHPELPPRYYAVQSYDKACDKYQPSNPETK